MVFQVMMQPLRILKHLQKVQVLQLIKDAAGAIILCRLRMIIVIMIFQELC